MSETWTKDFDGALRLEAGDLILRVKKITRGWDWGVYRDGNQKWSGWHSGHEQAVLDRAKRSAKRCALKTIMSDLKVPEDAVEGILEIAGLPEENDGPETLQGA